MQSFTGITFLSILAVVVPILSPSYPGGSTSVTGAGQHEARPQACPVLARSAAQGLLEGIASPFVPNLGQWPHQGRFVHRAGPMTVFLEDRGWTIDLVKRPARSKAITPHGARAFAMHQGTPGDGRAHQKARGVALRMTFEGDAYVPEIVGEKPLPGHHNYFLGNDESRWRTGVPLYGSVRYQGLYPGIDLRLREVNGVPEYDLLLEPGADVALVSVHVEGGKGLSIADDGSLVIETALGPLTQPRPKTWHMGRDGRKHEVACCFTLLGADRFGFLAPGWAGDTSLTIDPQLIWSTFLGGSSNDGDFGVLAMSVDAGGMVTVGGTTKSSDFPMATGAYNSTWIGQPSDAFLTCLDPSKPAKQLVHSTFLGGDGSDGVTAVFVDAGGVVTVAGGGSSRNFPTTKGAYNTTYNTAATNNRDGFVSRLDPSKNGPAQLLYSTYLGGSGSDHCQALHVDASGVVTVAGMTMSNNFPTTKGAYNTTYNRGLGDAFVSRLDPRETDGAQLLYSTYLGGSSYDHANQVSVDTGGVVTVAGFSFSSNYPFTSGAYDTKSDPAGDAIVSRLDPRLVGSAQLVYSTFLGGGSNDDILGLAVGANGLLTVTGWTSSNDFPTTSGAYDTTYNGGNKSPGGDAFVSRLIPRDGLGKKGLVYSTFLGGSGDDFGGSVSVDANGVITVSGSTQFAATTNFPTTTGAYDPTHNGGEDAFIIRLDPNKTIASQQLVYSTYLGGSGQDVAVALSVDASGVATVAGLTSSGSGKFPTSGAYDTTFNGVRDIFVSRVSMGVAFYADRYEVSLSQGGAQKLQLDAGRQHAGRSYAIFGSVTGTSPGINLAGIHIPLDYDPYTDITIASFQLNPPFTAFRGVLDKNGEATASFNVPSASPASLLGMTLHHAYVVYDKNGIYMASNPVPLTLVK